MREVDLVILGAGPGGLAAAIEAARAGVEVLLLDENVKAGGQIYRQFGEGFSVTDPGALGRDYKRGRELIDEYDGVRDKVEHLNDALVWGLFEDRELAYVRGEESRSVRYKNLIVSVGAYDRPVPFPGWTLPGVMTAGGAQSLVKTQRVLPGEQALLVGTGPLQLALANQLVDAGGRVEAIAEAGNVENWLRSVRGAWGQWELMADAWHYWRGIRRAGIPLLRNHIIVEARGNGHVEEAVVAEADDDWRPKPGTERTFAVDTLCVGYGFVPSVELTRLAECAHRYEPLLGGWVPERGANMETSVAGVYAVGDCSGVAGSFAAEDQGRIAGLAVAASLGRLGDDEARRRQASSRKRLDNLNRLRRVLDEISEPRAGLWELAREDTIICRCEELTLGDIREAVAEGATELNELKRMTRAGMGHCQGRMCGQLLQALLARERGVEPTEVGYLNPRPPVKPVTLSALANHAEME